MKVITLKQCLLLMLALFLISLHSFSQQVTNSPRLIIPFGHQDGIMETVFSHANKFLITSDPKMAILYDVRTGKPLNYLVGHHPAISFKDEFIATTIDTTVMIWSMTSDTTINTLVLPSPVKRMEFNPVNNLLIIEMAEGEQSVNVYVWDITKKQPEHVFSSKEKKQQDRASCQPCNSSSCPIYGGWFTSNGDSIRLVYEHMIQTFGTSNYSNARSVCMKRPGKEDNDITTTILNDRIIKQNNDGEAWCFDQNGTLRGQWIEKQQSTLTRVSNGRLLSVDHECVSPAFNYAATYTSTSISMRDLKSGKSSDYEVIGGNIKNLTFNKAGTHVLIEFLNEPPRIQLVSNLNTTTSFNEKTYDGFPTYVFKTNTEEDIEKAAGTFDSIEIKMPPNSKSEIFLKNKIGLPSRRDLVGQGMNFLKEDINRSATNSGEIVNLSTNRTICKVQSLIKQTGDLKLSPDQKLLLLNTGKLVSVYSIPYARVLLNLRTVTPYSQFSPDSRWLVQYVPGKNANIVDLVHCAVKAVPFTMQSSGIPTIVFSPDSKQVTISSTDGGYAAIDVIKGTLLKPVVADISYYASADGARYGLVNTKEHTAQIFMTGSDKPVSSFNLARKPNGKKDKSDPNYRISFSSASPAAAIWSGDKIIYVRDIQHPTDTSIFPGQGEDGISRLTVSPNGKYVSLQLANGSVIILNPAKRDLSFGVDCADRREFSLRKLFKSIFSGDYEALLNNKEHVKFSITGDSVMVCRDDSALLYQCATGGIITAYSAGGDIKYFSIANNLLIGYYYGQLKFYKTDSQRQWFSMIPFKGGETVYLLPGGLYFGSKSATRQLGYMADVRSLSYKQFDFNNNRPDSVFRALGNTDAKHLALYDSSIAIRRRREGIRNTRGINFELAPTVVITNEKDLKGEVKVKDLSLQLSINGNADKLCVYINGNPLKSTKGIPLSHKRQSIDTTINLTLTEGNNSIEVSAFDANGQEGYRQPLYVTYAPDSAVVKNIYFVGMGVGQYKKPDINFRNLTWAKNDVNEVLDSLQAHYGHHVIVDTFFNSRATLGNLQKVKNKLERTKPDDIVIIYYSGHGVLERKKSEAYFGTYDMDFADPSSNGITIKDFNDLMDNIPSRNKVVFLDACHSGELNKNNWSKSTAMVTPPSGPNVVLREDSLVEVPEPGASDPFDLMLEMFTDLYQGNGTNVIVAARGLERAKECEDVKHGIFTYAVLNGIAQLTADVDSNAILTIGELQNYVVRNVVFFSKICNAQQVQRAAMRKENEFNDWAVITEDGRMLVKRSVIQPAGDKGGLINRAAEAENFTHSASTVIDPNASGEERRHAIEDVKQKFAEKIPLFKKSDLDVLKIYGKKEHPKADTLVNDPHYTVLSEVVKDKVIFTITCAGLIPAVRVDMNSNKAVDPCVDRIYKIDEATNALSAAYLTTSSQSCNNMITGSTLWNAGDKYFLMIPLIELGTNSAVNFVFHGNNMKEDNNYPQQSGNNILGNTLKVKL